MTDHSPAPPAVPAPTRDSKRLQTLYLVNDLLKQAEADGLDINNILPRILRVAQSELRGTTGSIIVVDQQFDLRYVWLIDGPDDYQEVRATPFLNDVLKKGLAGHTIRTHEPSIISDTRTDKRWLPRADHITARESWSAICVPFLVRSRSVGALTILKEGADQFTLEDKNLLTAIASQAASIIENARLYEEAQRQLRVQNLLMEAGRVINSTLNLNDILQSLLSQMNELLNAEALSIALVDEESQELVYTVAEGVGSEEIIGLRLPASQGVSGWVMEHGEAALVPDTSADPRFSQQGDERTQYATRAIICAPMTARSTVLGTIQAINPNIGRFTGEDLDLLVTLANLASSAIANAQQFAQTQAAEERYLGLFEDSIDPIILTNSSGVITGANRPALSFFDYEAAELLDHPLSRLHPHDQAPVNERKFRLLFEGDSVRVVTGHALTRDQRLIPVEIHAKRTRSSNQDVLQWIYHDISKQVELEEMRRDLTAMLFHDLQSPLSNVISSLQLLEYELSPDSDEGAWEMLDIALRSSQRLQNLVRSLLDIHRLEEGNVVISQQVVDLANLVAEAHEIVLPSIETKGLGFETQLSDNLPGAFIDEDMIRRVLVNLLDNAIKFNPERQTITVAATRLGKRKKLHISVSDEGTGIPARYRNVIFDKFRRVQGGSSAKGLGLGLAFCRMAVEAHGGEIWVDDSPSGGARFNFTVPILPPHAASAAN